MWPWDRTTWANFLATINSDADTAPAVIGMTVSFYGDSQPISDTILESEITKENVVLACAADFTTEVVAGDSIFSSETKLKVSDVSYPYLYPNQNITLGHTNILVDSDGILRHGLLSIETPQGGTINSMAYECFTAYNEYYGLETNFDPVLDDNGFWYVDYSASSGEYYDYSISDIIHGNYKQSDLTGKIVLVGVYDTTLMDYYRPSIDHGEIIYGVEFMANCIDAMISDTEIRQVEDTTELVVLLISTFLLTFLALHFSFTIVTFVFLALAVLGTTTICLVYHFCGILYPPFFYLVGIATCYVLSVGFNFWFAWYSKKHVTNVFKQFVDPKVMDTLMKSNIENLYAPGSTRNIAVLFVDLRGFTSISEKVAATTVVDILNEFFTLVDDCIKKNNGTLDKFIGDCAMAFWGAPDDIEDPCYHACCAAKEMMDASDALAKSIFEKYGVEVAFGIGVHYGSAVVGNVGSSTRLDYTAIGDTVNTAARLESAAPSHMIYISEEVVHNLGDMATVTILPETLSLKGKEAPMSVYTLETIAIKEEKEEEAVL